MGNESIPLTARFSEALSGAADLHARHFRKGTTIPYISHLLGVCSIALQHGADEDEAIAALLHDATAILSDHREIGDEVFARFNKDAGKAGTISYYRGLVTAYRATGHHPRLCRELETVVAQIEEEAGYRGDWPMPAVQERR